MSYSAQTVRVNNKLIDYLPKDRIVKTNLRLNSRGRKLLERMNHDNEGVLWTRHGWELYNVTPETSIPKIKEVKLDFVKVFNRLSSLYSEEVRDAYSATNEKVLPRSIYIVEDYGSNLGEYGGNVIDISPVKRKIMESFWDTCAEFFSQTETVEELVESREWLTHIKSGSNSGYPMYESQSKEWAEEALLPVALKLFYKFKKDPKSINWNKLPFSPGMRTERAFKQRFVAMAAAYEKPISALMNTFVDKYLRFLNIHMPRVEGALDNLTQRVWTETVNGKYPMVSKDYSGFDLNTPEQMFEYFIEFLDQFDTDIAWLMKFEVTLALKSAVIVGNDLLFVLKSLPSGIGITQFLGSVFHKAYDDVVEFIRRWATYQSDDTISVIDYTEKEVIKFFDAQEEIFGIKISPLGEKSYYGLTGIILQTWISPIDDEIKFFGHEQRRWTNLNFRERALTPDDEIAALLGLNLEKKEDIKTAIRTQHALSMLGTLGSLGKDAPMLPYFVSKFYGPKSGYKYRDLELALPILGEVYGENGNFEQLRFTPSFIKTVWEMCLDSYGYGSISTKEVEFVVNRL